MKNKKWVTIIITGIIGILIGACASYFAIASPAQNKANQEKNKYESLAKTTKSDSSESAKNNLGEDKTGLIPGKYQVGTTIKPGSYTLKVVKADNEVGGGITLLSKMDDNPNKDGEDIIVGAKVGNSAHVELKAGQVLDIWDDSNLLVDLIADK